jgi:hypothetical protein
MRILDHVAAPLLTFGTLRESGFFYQRHPKMPGVVRRRLEERWHVVFP